MMFYYRVILLQNYNYLKGLYVEHLNSVINGGLMLCVIQKLIYLKESPVQTWMCKKKDNRYTYHVK